VSDDASLFIRLYLDEDVHKRVAAALRLRHFDVISAHEIDRLGGLAPVCSPAALRLFLALVAGLLTTSPVACACPRRCGWPRGGLGGSTPTIGSASQTR